MISETSLIYFILAFMRIASFLFVIPYFNSKSVPTIAKIVIAGAISYATYGTIHTNVNTVWQVVTQIIEQCLIGFTLGYIVQLIFTAAQIGGSILDLDMGFAASNVIDPGTNQSETLIGNMYSILFTLTFVGLGGFRDLISNVVYSFQFTEHASSIMNAQFLSYLLDVIEYMLSAAVQIALPLMFAMFILNIIMLIMGRIAPQMNIFNVAYAVKMAVGILLLILVIPYVGYIFQQMESVVLDKTTQTIQAMHQIGG